MFFLVRGLFAFLLFIAIGGYALFHFYGAAVTVTSFVSQGVRSANEKILPTAASNNYVVKIRKGAGRETAPPLPDISQYTVDNVAAKVPAFVPGKVAVRDMAGLPALRQFINMDGRLQRLRLSQMSLDPQAIFIQEGHYDLTRLYEEIKAQTGNDILQKDGSRFLLRLPILVGENASLTISDKDTSEFLLSQERNVFIANAGKLFIVRTKITGWSEKDRQPAYFREENTYRPFLISWSGAEMHIAGSTLASLGYGRGKSYGISYSACDRCLLVNPALSRSTGSVVGSRFVDLYYGFYSYEADDVAIVGNIYSNSVIYGIDPHDRSRRLIIAGNEISGSKKHGIIISRSVNDSWIFNNYSHDNRGSGIMLDRTSEHNIVANNVSARNHGDGITLFESQNNVTYNNTVYKNKLSGIRIRNSWNIKMIDDRIADNGTVPIVIYSANLDLGPNKRNLVEDPYSQRAEVALYGTIIKLSYAKPAVKVDGIDALSLSGVRLLSGGAVFADRLFSDETDISENMGTSGKVVMVTKKSALLQALQLSQR